MLKISFSKYSGCGNDFILIDNRDGGFPSHDVSLIRSLCRRSLGIGADGLILVEDSCKGDFLMRIFNSDGKEAEMCGNGLRCFGMFLKELKAPGTHFNVEVSSHIYPISIEGKEVSVAMVAPQTMEWEIPLEIGSKDFVLDYLDTGVPHAVQFVNNIEKLNVEKLGPKIRHHKRFSPRGTNVDFAELIEGNTLAMRTYERGVEGETLACGTGACAVAIAASRKYGLDNPIVVKTRSGENLKFELVSENGQLKKIMMKGPAKQIYSGIVEV